MDNKIVEYTYMWIIENYSFCTLEDGQYLFSPELSAEDFEDTSWFLRLNRKGGSIVFEDNVSLHLHRSCSDNGPEDYELKFELSIHVADKMYCQPRRSTYTFKKNRNMGYCFFSGPDDFLLQDNLRVQFKLWRESEIRLVKHITARTCMGIEEISFLHVIDKFSSLQPNERKSVNTNRITKYGFDLVSTLFYSNDLSSEGKILMEIIPLVTQETFYTCKISLIDRSGNLIVCGKVDNRSASRINTEKLPLTITRHDILEKKYEYLPNDNLSLKCELNFARGVKFSYIEKIIHGNGMHYAISKQINKQEDDNLCHKAKRLKSFHSALDDFKTFYNNQLLSDVELKTKTKSFSTHKFVLCARSCVFKVMLTNDMKEKNTNSIYIDDLDDETVEKLLIFLYSDNLENLQWKSAIKLYYAADKYAIAGLKAFCFSFLLGAITTATASELLVFAHTLNDSKLKKAVEDFILKHEEEVFGSEEWGDFIETNSVLASKTMRLKYKR